MLINPNYYLTMPKNVSSRWKFSNDNNSTYDSFIASEKGVHEINVKYNFVYKVHVGLKNES